MSQDLKKAEVIVVLKPGKSPDSATSYRPISLLPILPKLYEKLLLKRLKLLLQEQNLLPDEQFGFREKHSTIDQVHRLVALINYSLESKKYCCAAVLDSAQALDRVWHQGLPDAFYGLLHSYLQNRQFQVRHTTASTSWHYI